MGTTGAIGMAQAAGDDEISLDMALSWHLQSNHYPPIPTTMVPVCKAAIAAFVDEDYEREVDLPSPISYKGRSTAPASAIVEAHHLDAFVDAAVSVPHLLEDDEDDEPVDFTGEFVPVDFTATAVVVIAHSSTDPHGEYSGDPLLDGRDQ